MIHRPAFTVRVPWPPSGRSVLANGVILLLALKPVADALSERTRDTQLDVGTLWTTMGLVALVVWVLMSRSAHVENWILALATVTILAVGVAQMVLQAGPEALIESAKIAAGLAPAVIVLDAVRRRSMRRALIRWAPVFVMSIGVHVITAWLQFFGRVSTTYTQAGSGRPTGLFFHPVTLGYLLVATLIVVAILHQRRLLPLWLALSLAGVATTTVVITTHRTSIIAAAVVLAWWLLGAVMRWRSTRLRRILAVAVLSVVALVGAVGSWPALAEPAGRAASGITSVLSVGDFDPTSERFLRGRGERWGIAIDTIRGATPAQRLSGFGYQVVDPHSDYLRLPLVHGLLGSLLVLSAVGVWWLTAFRQSDGLGAFWLAAAFVVMALFAVTTKPLSYPSFVWAWTLVAAVAVLSRPARDGEEAAR